MSDGKKTIDSPDEKSVGSRDPKGPIPKEPIEGSAGETDGVMGTAGDVKQQDNPTSYQAG
ncbi:hypothetical protein HJG53_04915 [Sphingomonas sp. ID1715]|uniref:hypothetical protein n=1 Tax=Sphingomonas sp. ID1715 TaxID=1656898 RepID=UPI0014894331|nr:hypothetical protein [Sphingomonas sp. ID1715]NNM76243.1 hypothetical protein [Sphingomonas sp. ID1715]